jgi:branched-chain amino acid transport system permease protein
VLVFAVTRVIFIPQGEFVAYGALTLAAAAVGQGAGTVWLLLALGCAGGGRSIDGRAPARGGPGRRPRASLAGTLAYPWRVAASWVGCPARLPLAAQVALTLAIVVPLGPHDLPPGLPAAGRAPVLVLLIVSVAVHIALVGLGLLFFGAEGSAHPPFSDASFDLGR